MTDKINITVFGSDELVALLANKADQMRTTMTRVINELVLRVKNNVVQNHLSGPTGEHSLSRITGNLARSVQTGVADDGSDVVGRIFYTGDVPYAAIHEFGGTIHHPGGTAYIPNADKAGLMLFVSNAKAELNAPRTKAHDIVMPERAPLRTGFSEMADQIITKLKEGVAEVAHS